MAQSKKRGLFSRLMKRDAQTGNVNWLASFIDAFRQSKSGQVVSADTALLASAMFACTRVVSEDVSIADRLVRTRPNVNARWVNDPNHWLIRLLRAPNDLMSGMQFVQMMTAHAAIAGDGFAFINFAGQKRPQELLPFPVNAVTPEWVDGWGIQYKVRWRDGSQEIIPFANMFRLRGWLWDTLTATELYRQAREALGISLAAEESHALLHRNGVRLSGVLSGQTQLSDEQAARIAKQWKEEFGPGASKEFGVAVLEGGFKFEPMSMSGVDAQHIETRAFEIEEICRFMRVFPPMIGHFGKAATFASTEQLFNAHDGHTILPWCRRWEEAIEQYFLPQTTEPNIWVTFRVSGLKRGDAVSRSAFYNSGIHAGWLSPNEAREMEGLEEKDGLDKYLWPPVSAPGNGADATNGKNAQVSSDKATGDGAAA